VLALPSASSTMACALRSTCSSLESLSIELCLWYLPMTEDFFLASKERALLTRHHYVTISYKQIVGARSR
jgi:hypothetical protein